ncbi:hypothetical protein AQUCO_02700130v1 [Aquilegia coerulea]|uniref:Uncharacterized protein n=1 Tax=Aquilegia coerulea TaxID=218851 RepID=A0A2G5D5A7_AQUCA|nr:hypothetical protein AQUCO_02700130v1 [Aquilegia coerulea]
MELIYSAFLMSDFRSTVEFNLQKLMKRGFIIQSRPFDIGPQFVQWKSCKKPFDKFFARGLSFKYDSL